MLGIFSFSISAGGVSVGVGPGFGEVIAFVAAIIVLVEEFIEGPFPPPSRTRPWNTSRHRHRWSGQLSTRLLRPSSWRSSKPR